LNTCSARSIGFSAPLFKTVQGVFKPFCSHLGGSKKGAVLNSLFRASVR
jgi:hypothetical protein